MTNICPDCGAFLEKIYLEHGYLAVRCPDCSYREVIEWTELVITALSEGIEVEELLAEF